VGRSCPQDLPRRVAAFITNLASGAMTTTSISGPAFSRLKLIKRFALSALHIPEKPTPTTTILCFILGGEVGYLGTNDRVLGSEDERLL
jgi:hypothetical protein